MDGPEQEFVAKKVEENLYEGPLDPQWSKEPKFRGKEDIVRILMSQAIELGVKKGFRVGQMVGHPTTNKACKIMSIDEQRMFAVIFDGEKEYPVPYPELFDLHDLRILFSTHRDLFIKKDN